VVVVVIVVYRARGPGSLKATSRRVVWIGNRFELGWKTTSRSVVSADVWLRSWI
jgi:hypothetical protein